MTRKIAISALYASAAFAIIALLFYLVPTASAAASAGTCASTVKNTGVDGNLRVWYVFPSDTTRSINTVDCAGTFTPSISLRDINSGNSITLQCVEQTFAQAPPSESETVTVKGFPDNDNFGNTAATPIWTWTVSGGNCNSAPTFTAFCTSDGTNTGTPKYGIVRIQIHAVRSTPVAYDVNSEGADETPSGTQYVGIYRCNPQPTTLTDNNIPSGTNPYVGGDTIATRVVVDSTAYGASPGNTGNVRAACNNRENGLTSLAFTSSGATTNIPILGSADTWQTGCTVKLNATLSKTSAITGFTSVQFSIWDQASPPTGVTFPSSTVATFTSHALNRILTPSSCSATPNFINRGATSSLSCTWKDARGNNVPNNDASRNYANAATYRDTTCFDAVNTNTGGSGVTTWTATAHSDTSCTVTPDLSYHWQLDQFTAGNAGTEAQLKNWGNTTGILGVSATWTFDAIHNSKTAGGTNVSSFTIGADVEFVQPQGLRDVNNNFKVGIAVSCQRIKPDLSVESTTSFGNTNAAGTATETQFQAISPQGNWKFTCTASGSGNTGTYTITFQYVSAFTADNTQAIGWNVTLPANANGTYTTNISVIFRTYDPSTDQPISTFPDDLNDVKLNVQCFDLTTFRYSDNLVTRMKMTQNDGGTSASWYFQAWPTGNQLARGCVALVNANITARPFLASEYFILKESLTPLQKDTVQDMTTFFSTPTTTLVPLFLMMAASLFFFMRSENKITSFFFALIDIAFLLATVAAKTTLDGIATIYALLGVLFFAAMTILTLVKAWTAPPASD